MYIRLNKNNIIYMSLKENNEINLVEIFTIIIKNKWKILSFVVLSIIFMLVYLSLREPIELSYEARTEVKSISSFDELEYAIYNNSITSNTSTTIKLPINGEETSFLVNEIMTFDNSSFKRITKEYLLDLFYEKIDQNQFLADTMIEFGLIDKNNYKNDEEYKSDVTKLAKSLQLLRFDDLDENKNYLNEKNKLIIKFETKEPENWNKYLKFLEKETNYQIQKHIYKTFDSILLNKIKMNEYKIADLDLIISNLTDTSMEKFLEINKQILLGENDIDRLKISFNTTPIKDPNKFHAAYIDYDSTKFVNISNQRSSGPILIILSIVLGLVIGMIYVIILNSIKRQN